MTKVLEVVNSYENEVSHTVLYLDKKYKGIHILDIDTIKKDTPTTSLKHIKKLKTVKKETSGVDIDRFEIDEDEEWKIVKIIEKFITSEEDDAVFMVATFIFNEKNLHLKNKIINAYKKEAATHPQNIIIVEVLTMEQKTFCEQ